MDIYTYRLFKQAANLVPVMAPAPMMPPPAPMMPPPPVMPMPAPMTPANPGNMNNIIFNNLPDVNKAQYKRILADKMQKRKIDPVTYKKLRMLANRYRRRMHR